ncbi:PQQ-binding-like beta-propeller repeat protein [Dactylosporangium sp. NPDC049742]|uniref:outer membrane protein assembly factor BamB family protein n=1 Tax=Dactylosporangium sp. NPDC049742 TaxID=3154737 RepID=UPI00342933EA
MAETVIELDLSVPWQPPEPPEPRRRLQGRWVAVAAVLAVTLGLLVSAGPRSGAGLLYTIEQQVLRAQTAGGRLFFARYQGTDPGPMIEAHDLVDGELLWHRSAEVQQQLVTAGDDVVLLMSEDRTGAGDSSTLVVLDAATGHELWTRSHVTFTGTTGDVVVVEDVPDELRVEVVWPDSEADVNRAFAQPERRFLGLSARTGAQVWAVTVPQGSDVNVSYSNMYQSRLDRFDVLSRDGRLTRWDTRTGRIRATHQLAWSGVSAMFDAGWHDETGRAADRVVVYPDGSPGSQVYELPTGRLLFHWPGAQGSGLFRCAADLFCAGDSGGMDAYDSTTGRHRWHLDEQTHVLGMAGRRLITGSRNDPSDPGPVALVDSRTGTVFKQLTGWHVLTAGRRPLLWRLVDMRTAMLGELDPETGVVTVFARAENWFGNPECSVDGDALACVVVGGLSVWRLPSRH